ncbi:energy transducer TonB [Phascolarctobacterium succinatutens]|uniref:energy transducer TonB n=1 Tax=Phascolarctobacterium succinatutens TaxID=626940 RepID=UPI0026ED0409|nr:energy transducer TonB [Phascolarctobacterium succinatutens]MBS5426571.1 energy transducer TonB [Phascolarctobacterium succinatutens]
MKQIEKLQAKARQRFGFCGSLIIHFILFVALAFSGVFAMQPPVADADNVVFFDAGGGGGGGGDEAVADAADDGEEQVEEVVEEETITLPDGKIEHKQVVKHVVKHVPAGAKKGSGSGSGGGHGTGHGTGTGSGIGAGSGSGSGGGYGAGHGSGIGDGVGPGIARNPKVPPRVASTVAPVYPQALRDAGIGGRVVVRGVIGTDGRVESAEVVRSSGNSTLDNNALSAFYKWRFSAAKNDAGQKVRCYFVQGFPFVIEYK